MHNSGSGRSVVPGLAAWFLFVMVAGLALSQPPEVVGLRVVTESLGQGGEGTVTAVGLQVAPEHRELVGERIAVELALSRDGDLLDEVATVVPLALDGSVMLYREWPVGTAQLSVRIAAVDGSAVGAWSDEVMVEAATSPFVAEEGAPPDAVALAAQPPVKDGGIRFRAPEKTGGIGAVQLEVEGPEHVARVEFAINGTPELVRNRPPWTVSVPLGQIQRRTTVRATAWDASGRLVGEDAVVLNAGSGQLGVQILLAPESSIEEGRRAVTVSVTGAGELAEVVLALDDDTVARWIECPCVVEVDVQRLEAASVMAAEATAEGGARGDAVVPLGEGMFFDEVDVELVQLAVVVVDESGKPVTGLDQDEFRVFEDGQEVQLDGFGTTEELPLSLGLAVDLSGSMIDHIGAVRDAVVGFADQLLRPGDEVMVSTFSWEAEVVVDWTGNASLLQRALHGSVPEGGTSLHDALVLSLEQFRGRRGRQALVVLTDGDDTTSRTGWPTTFRYAQTIRIPVFPIGFRIGALDMFVRSRLKELAETTGGEAFFPKKVDDLASVYARVEELLRAQYLLSYRSPGGDPEVFRSVEVTLEPEGLEARTISGYYPGR